jgi:hypothetical protein
MKIPPISSHIENALHTVSNKFIYTSDSEKTLLQQWVVSRAANSVFLILKHSVSLSIVQPVKLVEHSTNILLNTFILLTPISIMRSFNLIEPKDNQQTIDEMALDDLVNEISATVKVLFDVIFSTARVIRDTIEVILLNTDIQTRDGALNRTQGNQRSRIQRAIQYVALGIFSVLFVVQFKSVRSTIDHNAVDVLLKLTRKPMSVITRIITENTKYTNININQVSQVFYGMLVFLGLCR